MHYAWAPFLAEPFLVTAGFGLVCFALVWFGLVAGT